jgi:hypothetical protein
MRQLLIGLIVGAALGAVSATLVAQRSPASYPDAPTADPRHYRIAFENDVARFIRASYAPGDKSPMHRHLPGCTIFLTDQTMNFTVPDGSGGPVKVEAGAVGCGDGNVHQAENLEGPADFIIVEFKDRTTFRMK